MKDRLDFWRTSRAEYASQISGTATVLAIGDMRQWRELGGTAIIRKDVAFAEYFELDSTLLELVQPEIVLSPVFSSNFDCADLSLRLSDLGFTGSYRALATELPRPAMVEREIRVLCPTLDFAIADLHDLYRSV